MTRWITSGRQGTRVVTAPKHLAEFFGYLMHCVALVRPGVNVPVFDEPDDPSELPNELSPSELDILIDECQRQIDRQTSHFAELRSRSLAMTTVALTELGLLAATAGRFVSQGGWQLAVWIICFVLVALGLAGMASVASTSAAFSTVNPGELVDSSGAMKQNYAHQLLGSLPLGQSTIDTRTTIFRDGVLLMVLGAVAYGVLWLSIF